MTARIIWRDVVKTKKNRFSGVVRETVGIPIPVEPPSYQTMPREGPLNPENLGGGAFSLTDDIHRQLHGARPLSKKEIANKERKEAKAAKMASEWKCPNCGETPINWDTGWKIMLICKSDTCTLNGSDGFFWIPDPLVAGGYS